MSSHVIAFRLATAPQIEPPYDDESPQRFARDLPAAGATVRGTLALSLPAAPAAGAAEDATGRHRQSPSDADVPRLRLVGTDRSKAVAATAGGRTDPPPLARWTRSFVQALLEVQCGRRPVQQLLRWTSMEVYEQVRHRARRPWRIKAPPVVTSVRWSEPCEGVAEVSAVVQLGPRRHAVALRLEDDSGRWRCTAVELGPVHL